MKQPRVKMLFHLLGFGSSKIKVFFPPFSTGCGRVRHCTRWGFVYLIGLKFDSEIAARF